MQRSELFSKTNGASVLWILCGLLLLAEFRCSQAPGSAAATGASSEKSAASSDMSPSPLAAPAASAPPLAGEVPARAVGDNVTAWNPAIHSLDYEVQPMLHRITPGSKTFGGKTDRIFTDGLGREIYFRGFNVSGSVKHAEKGFKPFKNAGDARKSFDELGRKAGSNIVRFTIAWEGVHPAVDTIDYAYLDAIIAQMRAAFANT